LYAEIHPIVGEDAEGRRVAVGDEGVVARDDHRGVAEVPARGRQRVEAEDRGGRLARTDGRDGRPEQRAAHHAPEAGEEVRAQRRDGAVLGEAFERGAGRRAAVVQVETAVVEADPDGREERAVGRGEVLDGDADVHGRRGQDRGADDEGGEEGGFHGVVSGVQ